MSKMKEKVYDLLENTKFPVTKSRKNISSKGIEAFVLGDVNYRGQAALDYRTRGPSRFNKKFPKLFSSLKKIMKEKDPSFKFTTIQLNKNILSPPHVDKNNVGPSYIIAFGDYDGGKLVIEGKEHNIKNRFLKFDGTKGHWVTPFKGTRYSLVFFTHTFKPPSALLRGVEVKHKGLYNNGELIKKYITKTSKSKSRKTKNKSRKSRKTKNKSRKTKNNSRKTKNKSRKTKNNSRKTKTNSRKTKNKSRKTKNNSRKTKSKSRKTKSKSRKTKSKSRKTRK